MFLKLRRKLLSSKTKRLNSYIGYYKKKKQYEELKEEYKSKKKIPTSKLVLAVLLTSFFAIQIFTGWATIQAMELAKITGVMDWTPLVTLISSMVGSVISVLGYYAKSTKENTTGGIIYETAMIEYQTNDYDLPVG